MENMPKSDSKLILPAEFVRQRDLLNNKLTERGLAVSAHTFTTSIKIYWKLHCPGPYGRVGNHLYQQTSGDLLNIGNGDWLYVGSVTGTQQNFNNVGTLTLPVSLEYTASSKSLKWSVDDQSMVYSPISDSSPAIQYKADVNGSPKVIIVREYVAMGYFYLDPGTYTTFA